MSEAIIHCPNCGTKNRITNYSSSVIPVCAKCRTALVNRVSKTNTNFFIKFFKREFAKAFFTTILVLGVGVLLCFVVSENTKYMSHERVWSDLPLLISSAILLYIIIKNPLKLNNKACRIMILFFAISGMSLSLIDMYRQYELAERRIAMLEIKDKERIKAE